MCMTYNQKPTAVCQVGNLIPGQRFYDPRVKDTFMVVNLIDSHEFVSLTTGELANPDITIKLADRGDGQLYASRTLNGWEGGWKPADPVQDALNANLAATVALQQQLDDNTPLTPDADDQPINS